MAEKKEKRPEFTSPRGVFKFPKLTEPDYGTKDYPKPDGEYSDRLVLKEADPLTQAFIAKLQPLHDAAIADAKEQFKKLKPETRKKLGEVKVNGLYTQLLDKETEEPTGEIEFKFAMKASGEYKKGPKQGTRWNRKPALFDAKGTPLPKGVSIWGGTEGKVSFEAGGYFIPGTGAAGLKLGLNAVQVIKLVSAGQRDAGQYGFGEEEGYDASDYVAPEENSDAKTEAPAEGKSPASSDEQEF